MTQIVVAHGHNHTSVVNGEAMVRVLHMDTVCLKVYWLEELGQTV